MDVISVINQKGGVAKTTTTINVASLWAKAGQRTLVIDLDPQASASKAVFGDQEFDNTIYDVLVNRIPLENAVQHSPVYGFDIVPGEPLLSGVDIQLAAHYGREQILRKKLDFVRKSYDSVLIDCSPTLGLLTVNALMASNDILIPICPEFFSLKGIELILDTLKQLRAGLGRRVGVRGVVITRYRNRKITNEVIERLKRTYKLKVFKDYIPDTIAVEEAHHKHLPVVKYAPQNKASKAYTQLAEEIRQ